MLLNCLAIHKIARQFKQKGILFLNMKRFVLRTIAYTLLISLLMGLVSILVIGIKIRFVIGLMVGAIVSCIGFMLLAYIGKMTLSIMSAIPIAISYFVRMVGYGIVFLICIKIEFVCGIGCICGYVSLPIALMVSGFIPELRR